MSIMSHPVMPDAHVSDASRHSFEPSKSHCDAWNSRSGVVRWDILVALASCDVHDLWSLCYITYIHMCIIMHTNIHIYTRILHTCPQYLQDLRESSS